jgi:acylphosphatase
MVARRVRLYGRVQGVFYRQWTVNQARGLGVTGWVRNARDGSVEAHLEGEEPAVSTLIEQMRLGPPQARVENLNVEDVETEEIEGFSVKL